MAVEFVVILSALVASAFGSLLPVVANQDSSSFSYGVADPYTGDYKSQTEVREGDVVRGQYSLLDPDGTYRIVDYTADVNGFNAVVRKEPVAASVAAPTVVQSPALSDVVEASPVIAARTVAPVVPSVYQEAAPVVVASKTIAAPVVEAQAYATPVAYAAKTYTIPYVASESYASPALISKTYSPSVYAAKAYALPSIAKTYQSPSVVATNAYSTPVVYSEPSLVSSDYYGDSYLSPYYSAYGVNAVPVDAFNYYKK